MRRVDPTIELVACGSSIPRMPTFGTWEATVLEETYDLVDYVSMHSYYEQHGDDRDSFLAVAVDLDRFIDAVVATCDHVRAVGRHTKRINAVVRRMERLVPAPVRRRGDARRGPRRRGYRGHLLVVDAVVVGSLLISLLRHADRVRIGCLAQLVNVIAPIRTEPGGPAWRQTTSTRSRSPRGYGRGTVLRTQTRRRPCTTPSCVRRGARSLDAAADARRASPATVTLFAVNRDQHEPLALSRRPAGSARCSSSASTSRSTTTTRTRSTAPTDPTG